MSSELSNSQNYFLLKTTAGPQFVAEERTNSPIQSFIQQAYPNPFNSTTAINYEFPAAGLVSAGVFDMSGRLVTKLYDGPQAAGRHALRWRADDAPAGVYLCRIGAGRSVSTTKLVLVK